MIECVWGGQGEVRTLGTLKKMMDRMVWCGWWKETVGEGMRGEEDRKERG